MWQLFFKKYSKLQSTKTKIIFWFCISLLSITGGYFGFFGENIQTGIFNVANFIQDKFSSDQTTEKNRIEFSKGGSIYSFSADLKMGTPKAYILKIHQGQHMFINSSKTIEMKVLKFDNTELYPLLNTKNLIEVIIPKTDDYTIVLAGDSKVEISINIPPLNKL